FARLFRAGAVNGMLPVLIGRGPFKIIYVVVKVVVVLVNNKAIFWRGFFKECLRDFAVQENSFVAAVLPDIVTVVTVSGLKIANLNLAAGLYAESSVIRDNIRNRRFAPVNRDLLTGLFFAAHG